MKKEGGPGFRFLCQNCPKDGSRSRRRFLLELSTQTEKWQIVLDYLPRAWLHFAFTWHKEEGLKLYKNGEIFMKDKTPQRLSRALSGTSPDKITLARPNVFSKLHSGYGKFDVGHLVIWNYERSAYDIEVAFLTVLAKTTKSLICCFRRRGEQK